MMRLGGCPACGSMASQGDLLTLALHISEAALLVDEAALACNFVGLKQV